MSPMLDLFSATGRLALRVSTANQIFNDTIVFIPMNVPIPVYNLAVERASSNEVL